MAAPQIAEAYDNASPVTTPAHYGDYTNDTSPVLHISLGDQAVAGEQLLLQDNGVATGQTLTLTAADVSRGTIDLQLSNLSEGWHPFTIVLAAADGSALAASMPFALGVETVAPAVPTITAVTDDFGAKTGVVANSGRTDDATPTFTISEAGLPPPPTSSPGHAPYGGPAIQGGLIDLYDGTTLVGQARVLDGPVTITTGTLAQGDHVLTAVAVDRAGNVSAVSAPFHVVIGPDDTGAPSGAAGGGSVLNAGPGALIQVGGAGADTITGAEVADVLHGGAGADSIVGGSQFNSVNGNAGADTIIGHSVVGDWLLGGQGDDVVNAAASTGHNIINGNLGADSLTGGSGGDIIRGGQDNDVIVGGASGDWISGDRGSNTLAGGGGADVFHAGPGTDVVVDFNPSEGDRVQVDRGETYTAAQSNDNVLITLAHGGQMTLQHTQLTALQPGWIFAA